MRCLLLSHTITSDGGILLTMGSTEIGLNVARILESSSFIV